MRQSKPKDPWIAALGERIRRLRERKGYTQEHFADIAGFHRSWMGAIERAEHDIAFSSIVRIARALDVSLAQLLSGMEKRVAQSSETKQSE